MMIMKMLLVIIMINHVRSFIISDLAFSNVGHKHEEHVNTQENDTTEKQTEDRFHRIHLNRHLVLAIYLHHIKFKQGIIDREIQYQGHGSTEGKRLRRHLESPEENNVDEVDENRTEEADTVIKTRIGGFDEEIWPSFFFKSIFR